MRCLAIMLWMTCALPAWADARLTVLMDVLRIQETVHILQSEGLNHSAMLDQNMLDGKGGAAFAQQAVAIFDPDRMVETIRTGLDAALTAEETEQVISFFASPLGAEIASLENAARAAMARPEVAQNAITRYAEQRAADQDRMALIAQFAQVNDVISRNVTAGMNDTVQFMTGLAKGGALLLSEDDILNQVMADQATLTAETENWLFGYFLLAFSPLSDDQLRSYIAFSETPAGQALNTGLFDGFGAANLDISYALGRAVALHMTNNDL